MKKDAKAGNKVVVPTDTAGEIPEALQRFGKDKFMKAVSLAIAAIHEVSDSDQGIRKLESEILLKKEGNSHKVHRIAIKCVELTAKGKVAQLADAAVLFRDACKQAEEEFIVEFSNKNPGADTRIQVIVPSWPVLRSEFGRAMEKAMLDPRDYVKPTELREAFKAWKSNPDNASDKDGRGRKYTGNVKSDVLAAATGGDQRKIKSMTNNLKTSLATLIGTLQGMTEEQQDIAAEKLAILCGEFNAMLAEAAETEGSEDVTRPPANPARETEHAPHGHN